MKSSPIDGPANPSESMIGKPPSIEGISMPKGPKGEKRPADVIGAAVTVAKIATGEIEEEADGKEYARKGGMAQGLRVFERTSIRKIM